MMSSSTKLTKCHGCGGPPRSGEKLRCCSRCKKAWYHDANCQRRHYRRHREACLLRVESATVAAATDAPSSSSTSRQQRRQQRQGATTGGGTSFPRIFSVLPFADDDENIHILATGGLKTVSEDKDYWANHRPDDESSLEESITKARESLPQAPQQVFRVKLHEYWTKADKSDVRWYLEVLNSTPEFRNETKNHLLMYREPWDGTPPPGISEFSEQLGAELIRVLLTVMSEGGRLMSHHSVTTEDLRTLPQKKYFVPRRPGMIWIDPKLGRCCDFLRSHLEEKLNLGVLVFGDASRLQECGENIPSLFETRGNTVLAGNTGIRIRCVTVEERRQLVQKCGDYQKEVADDVSLLYPPAEELTSKKPRWECDGYESLEDALQEWEADREENPEGCPTREELEEDVYGWQEQDYPSLEEACMSNYQARSIEEAIWDEIGIPRLVCEGDVFVGGFHAGDDLRKELRMEGWTCEGYKPGKQYEISENTVKYGHRLVHECPGGYVWGEPRKRTRET